MAMRESKKEKALMDLLAAEHHGPECDKCLHREICRVWSKQECQRACSYMTNCFAAQKDYIRKSDILNHLDAVVEACERKLDLMKADVSDAILAWAAKDLKKRIQKRFQDDEAAE